MSEKNAPAENKEVHLKERGKWDDTDDARGLGPLTGVVVWCGEAIDAIQGIYGEKHDVKTPKRGGSDKPQGNEITIHFTSPLVSIVIIEATYDTVRGHAVQVAFKEQNGTLHGAGKDRRRFGSMALAKDPRKRLEFTAKDPTKGISTLYGGLATHIDGRAYVTDIRFHDTKVDEKDVTSGDDPEDIITPVSPVNPVRDPDGLPDALAGKWMLIHEVSGTYLEADNQSFTRDDFVQVWNNDPLRQERSYVWSLVKLEDGSYLIRSSAQGNTGKFLYLEAEATAGPGAKRIRMRERSDSSPENDLQRWTLEKVGDQSSTYAIVSKKFPGYALGLLNNVSAGDAPVVATRTWGAPVLHHYWRLTWPEDLLGKRE